MRSFLIAIMLVLLCASTLDAGAMHIPSPCKSHVDAYGPNLRYTYNSPSSDVVVNVFQHLSNDQLIVIATCLFKMYPAATNILFYSNTGACRGHVSKWNPVVFAGGCM